MMEKRNIKMMSLVLTGLSLGLLFLVDYAKAEAFGRVEGVNFLDVIDYVPMTWILLAIPVALLILPYTEEQIKKQSLISFVLSIIGLLLFIGLYLYLKTKFSGESLGFGEVSTSIGFYFHILVYVVLIIVNGMALKNGDIKMDALNKVVTKASDSTSKVWGKVNGLKKK